MVRTVGAQSLVQKRVHSWGHGTSMGDAAAATHVGGSAGPELTERQLAGNLTQEELCGSKSFGVSQVLGGGPACSQGSQEPLTRIRGEFASVALMTPLQFH